jgi:uncharacterized protein YjiS (DUF1127 family)
MPADSKRNWMSVITRLLGAGRSWRANRRRTDLHAFMHMSDRMLADIGVRRADIHAAMSGLMPPERIARTHGGRPWSAQVCRLRPHCRQPSEAATDLSAAA